MVKEKLLIYLFSLIIGITFFGISTYRNEGLFNISKEKILSGDAKNYYDRASDLLEYGKYSKDNTNLRVVYYRPPGYPIFLAILMFLRLPLIFIIFIQIFLFAAVPLLFYDISSGLISGKAGIINAIILSVFIPFWNLTCQIGSEWISLLFWVLAVYYILKFRRERKYAQIILGGMFAGLAAITRGQFLLLSPLLIILFIERKRSVYSAILFFLLIFSVPIISCGPFAFITTGKFVIVSTQGGYALWWGNSPRIVIEQLYPVWNNSWDRQFYDQNDLIGRFLGDNGKSNDWFYSESYNFIKNYPVEYLKIYFFKFAEFFGFGFANESILTKIIVFLKNNFLFIISIPGFFIAYKEKIDKRFLYFVIISFIVFLLISLLTASLLRYRLSSIDPLMSVFGTVFLVWVISKIRTRLIISNK